MAKKQDICKCVEQLLKNPKDCRSLLESITKEYPREKVLEHLENCKTCDANVKKLFTDSEMISQMIAFLGMFGDTMPEKSESEKAEGLRIAKIITKHYQDAKRLLLDKMPLDIDEKYFNFDFAKEKIVLSAIASIEMLIGHNPLYQWVRDANPVITLTSDRTLLVDGKCAVNQEAFLLNIASDCYFHEDETSQKMFDWVFNAAKKVRKLFEKFDVIAVSDDHIVLKRVNNPGMRYKQTIDALYRRAAKRWSE